MNNKRASSLPSNTVRSVFLYSQTFRTTVKYLTEVIYIYTSNSHNTLKRTWIRALLSPPTFYDVGAGKHGSEFNDRSPAPQITTCKTELLPTLRKESRSFYWKRKWVLWFLRILNIFAQMLVFAVVGFLKWKSLYLNERERCYGRQIYAFNPHVMVKKCVTHTS